LLLGFVIIYILSVEIWRWVQIIKIQSSRRFLDGPNRVTTEHSRIKETVIATTTSVKGSKPILETNILASDKNWMLWDLVLSVPISRLLPKTAGDGGEYYHTVIEFKLKRSLPHVIFDSKRLRGYQYTRMVDGVNRISFKGDFDSSFQSYCPSGYTLDTLAFITPEVLEAMLELDIYDYEIIGDSFFCIAPLLKNRELVEFKLSSENVFDKLNDHIHNYRDSFVARSIPSNLVNHPLSKELIKASFFDQPQFYIVCIVTVALFYILTSYDSHQTDNSYYLWILLSLSLLYGIFIIVNSRTIRIRHKQTIRKLHKRLKGL